MHHYRDVVQPQQPTYVDDQDIARYHENRVVLYLHNWAKSKRLYVDTRSFILMFNPGDVEQYKQLIGSKIDI